MHGFKKEVPEACFIIYLILFYNTTMVKHVNVTTIK